MSDRKIYNTHDQLVAAGGGIAITYQGYGGSRSMQYPAWHIYRVNAAGVKIVTDSKAHWMDYGQKRFSVDNRDDKKVKFEQAAQWVKDTYGEEGPWKRNRMGDMVPERIQTQFPIKRN